MADASLRRLVADAKAARMNMLRVWGGGRYFKGGLMHMQGHVAVSSLLQLPPLQVPICR